MNSEVQEFIIQYEQDVLRFCFFLSRHETVARDLAQETFLKALSKPFKNVDNPKAYLFQIAKNLLIDMKRRQKYEREYETVAAFQASTVAEAELEVWQVLLSLEPSEQEVLMLVDREGLSIIEASKLMSLSESALKSRLLRARENFQKKWKS
jgi:RNA polymerase sigma-70 factor, ECF subfamily